MRTINIAIALAGLLAVSRIPAQTSRTAETQFKAAQHKQEVEGDLKGAIEEYKKLAQGKDHALAAKALIRMAECYEKLGQADAQKAYERVIREFGDQADSVSVARARLATLRSPAGAPGSQMTRLIWEIDSNTNDDPSESAPSPDGRYLGFTDWDTGDLGIRDLITGANRHLTNTGGSRPVSDFAEASTISPDGRQIAYGWFDNKVKRYELRVLPTSGPDSNPPRILHRSEETDYVVPYTWTPDGKEVVFARSRTDRTTQIAMVPAQGGTVRVLKSFTGGAFPGWARVSPDGRYIAYDLRPNSLKTAARDIFVLAIDSGKETVAVQSAANDTLPEWSPDGSQLLFFSDRTGSASLWALQMQSGQPVGNPRMIKDGMASIWPIGLTRNGSFYYGSGGTINNLYMAEFDSTGKAAKGPKLAIETRMNSNLGGSWSPDGRDLAYYPMHRLAGPGFISLVIRTMETGAERDFPLQFNIPIQNPPRWFPDGRSVLVVVRESERQGLTYYRVDLATGNAQPIHYTKTRGAGMRSPDVSRDGKSIFYVDRVDGDNQAVLRVDLDTGRVTELKRGTATQNFHTCTVSPDGKQLAYVMDDASARSTSIEVIPTGGGQPSELLRGNTEPSYENALAWSPDQRYVIFGRKSADKKLSSDIWRVSLTDHKQEMIGISIPGIIKSPAIRPDGRQIVFRVQESGAAQVWTLDNFLPKAAARN